MKCSKCGENATELYYALSSNAICLSCKRKEMRNLGIELIEENKMTPTQERHLQAIKEEFTKLVDTKYRKGQAEHGGDLFTKSLMNLLNAAIEEAIDQVVYLLTIKQNLED